MLNNLEKVLDMLKYIKKIQDSKMKNLTHNYQ